MICNDVRYNLVDVYFSKPITWRDYAIGKTLALVIVGLSLTAIPAILLLLLHNLYMPGLTTIKTTYWWGLSTIGFSLAVVVPASLAVLASSALLMSQRFAGIAVFMLLFGDLVVATMLAQMLHDPNFLILAFPVAINHVGQHLFLQRRLFFSLPWHWSLLFIVAVCLAALFIVGRKAKRMEIGA